MTLPRSLPPVEKNGSRAPDFSFEKFSGAPRRRQGAQFNLSDYDGRTALHIACCEGHTSVVQYLLDLGAPVHVRDRYGHTPLDDAVTFRRPTIVTMLRQTGAHLTMTPAKLAVAVNKLVAVFDAQWLGRRSVAGGLSLIYA